MIFIQKKKTELDYYNEFIKICVRNTEVEEAQQFGHVNIWERRKIANNFCQRVWNERKSEIIPKIDELLNKKPLIHGQKQLTEYTKKPIINTEEFISEEEEKRLEIELFPFMEEEEKMLEEDLEKQRKKKLQTEALIDKLLAGEFEED